MTPNYALVVFVMTLSSHVGMVLSIPGNLVGTENMAAQEVAQLTISTDMQMMKSFGCQGQACILADLSGSTGRDLNNDMGNVSSAIEHHLRAALECRGQSCLIADTAGSTGKAPKMKAEGAGEADIACIAAENPDLAKLLCDYDNKPPNVPKQDTSIATSLMQGLNALWRPITALLGGPTTKGSFTGDCAPNILIWAKGTMEPGAYGVFVGPYFTSGLPDNWTTYGVAYDPSVPGDFCLGIPGGLVAKDVINQAHQKCPTSDLFLSGYSQGAMVVRNGLARADDAARAKVKV
jgi:hypothetical protein